MSSNIYASNTPLHRLCQSYHVDRVELLLQQGADVHAKNSRGHIPLYFACSAGNIEIVKLLLQYGSATETNEPQWSALHQLYDTRPKNCTAIFKLLLLHGADVNRQDTHGDTLLHKFSREGNITYVRLLLKYGANIDAPDRDGYTPLWRYCKYNPDVARVLAENGADCSFKRKTTSIRLERYDRDGSGIAWYPVEVEYIVTYDWYIRNDDWFIRDDFESLRKELEELASKAWKNKIITFLSAAFY